MPPDQCDRTCHSDQQIDEEREPCGRYVNEHDPHALALLVIGRGDDEREIKTQQ
jgi:hypothetical protein